VRVVVVLLLCTASFVATATLVASAVIGARELRVLVPARAAPLTRPLVVVMPARNEAARIERTLDALLREPSAELSVVVYDDRSDDDTAARVEQRAAQDARLRLVRGEAEPPEGAYGKPSALAAAVEALAPADELLLFLDADVELADGALGGLVAAFEQSSADALSGLPRLELRSLAERLLVPVLTTLLGGLYRPSAVHDADAPTAFLNGQLILTTRAALASAGGWRAVQHTVLEDVALAGRLKGAGAALRLADLRAIAATRMYDSAGAIFEGFGKNALPLYGGRARVLGVAVLSLVFAWAPFVAPAAAWARGDVLLVSVSLTLLVVTLGAQLASRTALRVPRWPVVVGPLVYVVVFAVLVRAALARAVTWRGRRYRL
jgi:hypothetical protein